MSDESESIDYAASQICRLADIIDGATSKLISVRVGPADKAGKLKFRQVQQTGGAVLSEIVHPRGLPWSIVSELHEGEWLVRVRPNDSLAIETWDWHDWRKL